ncbi:MAG: sigma-54-dependent Fis family transcriptional regulator [Ignavibacteriae bacterium]|nr:sigma-54-dependent Fis family transcriptional regulator [Ignavibacteriota bacterium]
MNLATQKNRPAILFTHDLGKYAQTLSAQSNGVEYPVVLLPEATDMLDHLLTNEYGVVVVRATHPAIHNNSLLKHISERQQLTEVIVISDRPDVSNAVRLMKAGAFDVLVPPIEPMRLVQSAEDAITQFVEKKTRRRSEERNRALTSFEEIVGESPAMQLVRQTIATVAPSDANVFVWGESGTGKELVAKALHSKSKRASKPFIAINCAALPKDILENELFGHEKGAFTGALGQKPGCFELADGGTLFLDELGEMSSETQAKLLRAVEEQSFRRLGGRHEIKVDVRVVAATNREVASALDQGILRSDLYYRLSVVELELPPLRNRKHDIVPLATHFLRLFSLKYGKEIKGFTSDYIEMLLSYHWPGNIRELRNAVERAVVICPGESISVLDLPEKILKTQNEIMHISIPIGSSVEEAEKKLILETLASVGNNKAKAARILGVSRKTLHNKLHSFDWRLEGK